MNGNANGVAYSGDHTTPDAVYPNEQEHGHTHGHHHHDHSSSSTCVPSLIPPGIDPAHVDMRTFYPYVLPFCPLAADVVGDVLTTVACRYQPNEVKHRKRTTRQQLKVLEDVYKYDTKPNASLRKRLAEELGMLPRGVQVCSNPFMFSSSIFRHSAVALLPYQSQTPLLASPHFVAQICHHSFVGILELILDFIFGQM